MNGADLLAASLEDQGIQTVFNIPGFGILPFVEAIHRSDELRHVTSLNETSVGFLAEGYSRATRQPAFINVYQSTGTGFVLPALQVAWGERTPLVLTTTTNSRQLDGRDQYAAVPNRITDVTDQYTKWGFEVPTVERIPEAIDRAVTIATTPPMGPVHLAFPMDLYESQADLNLVDTRHGSTTTYSDTSPDSSGTQRVIEALKNSTNRVVLAGSEAGKHDATDELVTFAESTHSGVLVEGKRSYLPFPNDHELFIGHSTGGDYSSVSAAIDDADTLIFVGFELTETLRNQYGLFDTDKTIVQIATTPHDIGKQVVPDVALVGHPRRILKDLNQTLATLESDSFGDAEQFVDTHRAAYQTRVERDRQELADRMNSDRPTPLESLMEHLRDVVGDGLTVVHDAGDEIPFIDVASFESADEFYGISMKSSVQGWAIPAGIGAQLGSPDRDIVIFEGDGGFMFTAPNALYTAAKFDIPVLVVTLNNCGWRAGGYNDKLGIDWESEMFLGRFTDPEINFTQIAAALGVNTFTLEESDNARTILQQAAAADGPSLIEVPTGYRP